MADPNIELLRAMALALGPLRERLVFVGGCATGLLLTHPASAAVRATEDVDAIIEVATLAGYHAMYPLLAERDVYASHDLEDIITVVDGRAELADELLHADPLVRAHVVEQTKALLAHPDMQNALPGIVAQPLRTGIVLERLQHIAAMNAQ